MVCNGIVDADRNPEPEYYEVKKVYQRIRVEPVDLKKGKVRILNKYDFQNAFKIVKKRYDFILKELNLKMKGVS